MPQDGGSAATSVLAAGARLRIRQALRVVLTIGPTEAMHLQTWSDKAGNAPPLTDPMNSVAFPDLNKNHSTHRTSRPTRSCPRPRTSSAASSRSARSSAHRVLGALSDGKAMTAGEVAAATGLARGTVSTTLSKLAKGGEVLKAERGYRLP